MKQRAVNKIVGKFRVNVVNIEEFSVILPSEFAL